ncbi:MAG: inorganic diphosphatase [Acidobacteria bacterium]|nr:inorganic diphosphatase [Acidobacteriota bacterium]
MRTFVKPLGILALIIGLGVSWTEQTWVHPFAVPQEESDPGAILAVIEIPAGSFTKYEIDKTTGYLVVDRFQSMPVAYPANYGTIPSSLAGDGDPLDVLVLTREPIVPGAFIRVRLIGVLRMIDGGAEDDKVIAVPIADVDPHYDAVRTITDLPESERQRIEAFFRVYKDLPVGRKQVELRGFVGADAATASVRAAIDAYRRR